MSIYSILKNKVLTDFRSSSKEGILNEMIDLLKSDENIIDLEKVRSVVLEREKIMSTGIGNGFALPHGKTDGVKEIVAVFGKLNEPIEFESIDGKPVSLIFLMVGREDSVSNHIKMLSKISRIISKEDVHTKLITAESSEEILNIFKEAENNL